MGSASRSRLTSRDLSLLVCRTSEWARPSLRPRAVAECVLRVRPGRRRRYSRTNQLSHSKAALCAEGGQAGPFWADGTSRDEEGEEGKVCRAGSSFHSDLGLACPPSWGPTAGGQLLRDGGDPEDSQHVSVHRPLLQMPCHVLNVPASEVWLPSLPGRPSRPWSLRERVPGEVSHGPWC